jgi:hypothetical protein
MGFSDGERRLLLERLHPTIPELRRVVEGVQNCRRIPFADVTVDTDGSWPAISKRQGRIVATGARDGAISGQTPIEEQFLAESDFLRHLRIV